MRCAKLPNRSNLNRVQYGVVLMNRAGSVVFSPDRLFATALVLCGFASSLISLWAPPLAGAQNAGPPPNVTPPHAKSSSGSELTETAGGLRFSLAVPTEFSEKVRANRKNGASSVESVIWAPPWGKGESARATLSVTVNDGFNNMSPTVRTTEFVDAFLSSYPSAYKDFKKSPSKEVTINGRKFGMASWEGYKEKLGPTLIHGFVYVTIVGSKAVAVDSRDPTSGQTYFAKAENAARSIKVE